MGILPSESALDFARVFREVKGFFEREQLSYALAGAFALYAYGLSRATSDLDFVTESSAQARLVSFLESQGYETLHLSAGYSNHVHRDPTMGRLDFIYVGGDTSRKLFESCRSLPVMEGMCIAVPRPEHLTTMKIHAMKNDPQRTFQEMADILFLLRLPGIEAEEIRGYFEKEGMTEKYDEILKLL
jgi:hypothetical protein